jgi:hypothetical protein
LRVELLWQKQYPGAIPMTWKAEERVVQYEVQLSTDTIAEAREVVTNSPLGSNGEVKILA